MSRERVKFVVVLAIAVLTFTTTSRAVSNPAAPAIDPVDQAREQFNDGRYGEAADILKARVEYAPRDAAAYFWLGRARFELRDYTGAIAALERGVQLNPDDSEYHRWLGRIYGEEADRKRSLSLAGRVRQQFENAVRLGPKNLAARRDLLEFYLEAPWIVGGGDDKARQQVTAITELDSNAGHFAYAAYLAHRSDYSHAAGEYRAAVSGRPARIESCFEAAEFFEKREDAAGLRAAADGAASVDPAEPRLLYFRGVAGVIAGADAGAAESLLQQYLAVPARSDRPSAAASHEWLGRLYEKLGRVADARSEYRVSTALNPDRKSTRERLRRLG
jgi:tetratricopeptide (TPR) repeat protein